MKLVFLCMLMLVTGIFQAYSQEIQKVVPSDKPVLSWGGFVKAEGIYDSRQVVESREGYLLLYPKKVVLDKSGNDINAHGSFNQYAMTARLNAKVVGPDVIGAKTLAYIEGDFTGASNAENNSFRLRHAYVKLKWNHASLLAGQYWHPLNVPEMLPSVLALNTGAPFHPYSRHPQFRLDITKDKLNAMIAFMAQRDFVNNGPAGASSIYLRNSIVPNIDGQLQYVSGKLFAGAGIDYKRLTPRLVTDSNYATKASVNCISYTAFVMAKTKPLEIKMQWFYGQALNDHTVFGGYGVSSTDPLTNEQTYSPLNNLSGWITIQTTGKTWQGSLFAGYTRAFGSKETISGPVFARDADIDYVYRLSPMISFTKGKLVLAAECEYTTAAYGKPDSHYKVTGSAPVSNTRLQFSVGYFF